MRRRRLLQSLAAIPAAPAAAQYQSSAVPAAEDLPKLRETAADASAQGVGRFFNAVQTATLRNLAALIVPRSGDRPGAVEAGVVEFLDFLLRESGGDRQTLYKNGLDYLESEARRRAGKSFAQLSAGEAKPILQPLTRPWTYNAPGDPFSHFLREAKEDLLQATANSREFADAMSRRSRSASGTGAYWLPLD